MNILEVKNLSKIYGKGDTLVKAVDDVSFTVDGSVLYVKGITVIR